MRSHDLIRLKVIKRRVMMLTSMSKSFQIRGISRGVRFMKKVIAELLQEYLTIVLAPKEINDQLPPIRRQHRKIDSFTDEECKLYFR